MTLHHDLAIERGQKRLHVGILIFDRTVRVGCRAVGAVQVVTEGTEVCGQLAAVMRGVCDAAHKNPCAAASHIEERDVFFKPGFGHRFEALEALL